MNPITPAELAAYFDHTQLRAYAQRGDFEKLCAEAREYGFAWWQSTRLPFPCARIC